MKKRVRPRHVVKFDPRDPAVVKAIGIVKPSEDDRELLKRTLVSAMHSIGDADVQRTSKALETTKPGKRAARSLGRALRRVESVCKKIQLPEQVMLNPFTFNELVALAERCEAIGNARSAPKSQRPAEAMRDAVHHAYGLVKKYTTGRIATKAEGKFCQLAAVLLDNPRIKLKSGRRRGGKSDKSQSSDDALTTHCERYVRNLNKAEKRGPK